MGKVIEIQILDKLNIKPNNINLYQIAFTHTSYANEHHVKSYERLEFLGDAVLQLLMTDYLFKNCNEDEGEMTKLRSHYVCEDALFEYSKRLGLGKNLKVGKGEYENGGMKRKATNSDIFESFLGALYLDQGIMVAKKFFDENIIPIIESHEIDFFEDYKSSLQEYVQTDKKSLEYRLIDEEGPAHNKTFTAEVIIDDIVYGIGRGHTKKAAEQEAAKSALEKAQKG